ncbi:MAG: 3'-phosphoadenosine 5'-phosphosulfate sulfotransferase (PAPS reductase)/FAD synthetase [Candidatus Gerdarchaeota archaeon]|nr:MAG: 3'-phosphoadenosine 5'-phosphosulfate sulfotransferase (PAPS reductase)/FAD synthetase [Candidatus Gerdarchaeota archaeon]
MNNQQKNERSRQSDAATGCMDDVNYVVSLSGGKDSTAMLHWMIERGEKIHSVVFFDTGWEFPAMAAHIELVEQKTGLKVVRLTPPKPFSYWMFNREVVARKGPMKGRVARIGNGWPSPMRRWCTREKVATINRYMKTVENGVSCVGIAADERHREKEQRYPLIEYNKTEADCLNYCKELGYHWGGLYDIFNRVSCYCCPLQKIGDLRKLRRHYPELWETMMQWDMLMPSNRGFRDYDTVIDLECRFTQEDKQMNLWAAV